MVAHSASIRPARIRPPAELLAQIRRKDGGWLTPEELDKLAQLVRTGRDPTGDAYNALALSVRRFVIARALRYQRIYRCGSAELVAEGLAALPFAVRAYRPSKGGFLNYFAFCCTRAMTRAGARLQAHRQREATNTRRPARTAQPVAPMDPGVQSVRDALDRLPRKWARLVRLIHGFGGEPVPIKEAGIQCGLSFRDSLRAYRAALNRITRDVYYDRACQQGRPA